LIQGRRPSFSDVLPDPLHQARQQHLDLLAGLLYVVSRLQQVQARLQRAQLVGGGAGAEGQ
jgi:hypothetical protein